MNRRFIIGIILLIAALVGCAAFNPLRRSEPSIRHWLEKTTPLGGTIDQIRAIAIQHGWYNANSQGSDGYTTGTYIRGELGDYQGIPFVTSVTVFWEFDANNRLSNIRIWKTTDGL